MTEDEKYEGIVNDMIKLVPENDDYVIIIARGGKVAPPDTKVSLIVATNRNDIGIIQYVSQLIYERARHLRVL